MEPKGEEDFFGHPNVGSYTQSVLQKTMTAIKSANLLPSGDNFEYYNTFRGFTACMDAKGTSIIQLMSSILKQHGLRVDFRSNDLERIFDELVDANDTILERVGMNLDEASGARKKPEPKLVSAFADYKSPITTSWNKQPEPGTQKHVRLLAARNILRPQMKFKHTVDNSNTPFVPLISDKPNSIKPLAILVEKTESGEMYSHPYQCELDHFKPIEDSLKLVKPQIPKPLDEVELVFVRDVKDLEAMCEELKTQSEFAVDLEHHSYRSFQGITCLMQISTRDKDYIVDTLELRSELSALNDSFTDPKIVKVFHGADKDTDWLQRDFGVYVVNMFDTGQASRVLNFAHYSLAFLLKHYCKVDADKQFQLADWRIRPLPEEMIKYAREDTHYLLYIYDCVKNELLEKGNENKNLLHAVFNRSKLLCEKRYQKDLFYGERYLELYEKSRKVFNSRQVHALKHLYSWRDATARIQDESLGYVLPNHMLLQLAEILPREMQGILACCNPVPTLVRQNLNELHAIIFKSREQSLIKTEVLDLRVQLAATQQVVDLDKALRCPHDVGNPVDEDDDDCRPPLIVEDEIRPCTDTLSAFTYCKKQKPILSLRLSAKKRKNLKVDELIKVKSVIESYMSPYQRYKLVKPKAVNSTTPTSREEKVDEKKGHVERVMQHVEDLMETPQPEENSVNDSEKPSVSGRKRKKRGGKGKSAKELPDIAIREQLPERNPSKRMKKVKSKVKEPEEVEPYDYDNVDVEMFKGGSKNSTDDFNPNGKSIKHGKKVKRKRGRKSQDQKSMTYSTLGKAGQSGRRPKK